MLPIPYKADVELSRWPVLTLIVCAICIWVFGRQVVSQHAYVSALNQYCNHEITSGERLVMHYLDVPSDEHYCSVLLKIRVAPDRDAAIRNLAENSRQAPFYSRRSDSVDYVYSTLSD
ncbi:MAG TPA: hypothetical protein VET48_07305, partial [Steroidobacteraceae bacterium]|nr:hypothetical protein [Steroidobacteraceae bacterium]